MTVYELKARVSTGFDCHFFTRKTMRFFGDTMHNYGIKDGGTIETHWDESGNNYSETPRTIEIWELYRKRPVKYGLQSSAYFDKQTFRRVFKQRED